MLQSGLAIELSFIFLVKKIAKEQIKKENFN